AGDGPGPAGAEPPASVARVAPAGPMEASALARESGLAFEDQGTCVLLSSAELRARFYPGSDQVFLDGKRVTMGETASRQGAALVVPPDGVRMVRRALAGARAKALAL